MSEVNSNSSSNFSITTMKKALKKETSKRVSKDAADKLGEILENEGTELAEEAEKIAEEDGRETVRQSDIKQALRNQKK